jgi:hypothetical protein
MRFLFVMPVLVTGIHAWKQFGNEAWMAGTSPAMTNSKAD